MKSSRLWIIVLIILSSMMLACRYSINYQFFEKNVPMKLHIFKMNTLKQQLWTGLRMVGL